MRPFEKDSQSVVTKGRRKTKLAAPKTKSASAALIKRKNRNIRKKENDEDATPTEHISKDPCQFVPVRRKPLGEYMKLESQTMPIPTPMSMSSKASPSSPSPSTQGMRMSYAAAVETGSGVKVMISPRFNKPTASKPSGGSKSSKANKIIADTKFRIFDEQQPKPHIVRVDPKIFRPDVEQQKARIKNSKLKKLQIPQKAIKSQSKSDPNDVDVKALKLQFKRMACNAASNAAVAIKGNTLSASSSGQTTTRGSHAEEDPLSSPSPPPSTSSTPSFADSVSYLSFHHKRLQAIIEKQSICAICLPTPEPMMVPQFEDNHFKYLEEAALLAQNRTMLRLWMNNDQLIY